MAIKANATITLSFMVDVKAVCRYYKLQASTEAVPDIPTESAPSGWTDTEPTYEEGSTNSLYFVDKTVFTNDEFVYSLVSLSTSYEAAKSAYNKALSASTTASQAQNTADNAATAASNAQSTADTAKANAATAQSTANKAATAASNAQTAADNAQDAADTAKTTADNAASVASTASTNADAAKTDAATAKSDAATAKTTANTANETATDAQSTADAAATLAGAAKADAATARDIADSAQSTANMASTTANAAKTTASEAKTEAASASTAAGKAQSTAEEAKESATAAQAAADAAQSTADAATDAITAEEAARKAAIEALQAIVDNTIETWFYAGAPTLENLPASTWADDETKAKHVGDLYYDSETGYAYRFMMDSETGAFSWYKLVDADVTKALADIASVQGGYATFKEGLEATSISAVASDYETSTGSASLKAKVASDISASADAIKMEVSESYATKASIPTKVSDLDNDASYTTMTEVEKKGYLTVESDKITAMVSATATAQSTANTAKTNAATAQSTANAAKTAAATAQTAANSAQSAADTAKTTADSASETANSASSTASNALTVANTASTNANTAKSDAATAKSDAATAKTTANTANETAAEAKTTAATANTTATEAKNTADNATTAADAAQTTATAAQATANQVATDLTEKAAVIKGTQTAATYNWTGVAPFSELKDGMQITYWLPYSCSGTAVSLPYYKDQAGTTVADYKSGVALNLTLADGTTTGNIAVYYKSTTRATTHYAAGTPITLTYRKSVRFASGWYKGWWASAAYYSDTTDNQINVFCGKTGVVGVWANSLFMEDTNGTYQSLTTTGGTASTKARNTNGFKLGATLYINGNKTYKANVNITGTVYSSRSIESTHANYTINDTQDALTNYTPWYIVGTVQSGAFYLDEVWWTDTPNETGKVYILVGTCFSWIGTYHRFVLFENNPWYVLDGEKLVDFVWQKAEAGITVAADAIKSWVKSAGGATEYTQTDTSFEWTNTKALDAARTATDFLKYEDGKLIIGTQDETSTVKNVLENDSMNILDSNGNTYFTAGIVESNATDSFGINAGDKGDTFNLKEVYPTLTGISDVYRITATSTGSALPTISRETLVEGTHYTYSDGIFTLLVNVGQASVGQSTITVTIAVTCLFIKDVPVFTNGERFKADDGTDYPRGGYSSVLGYGVASGFGSQAFGSKVIATGDYASAIGYQCEASGECSHAEGERCKALGDRSHAEGDLTKASGYNAHAEGGSTEASGNESHAEGFNNTASGECSHAEGEGCEASGEYSHAGGHFSDATGEASFAHGIGILASGTATTAVGKYNATSDAPFVVGIGSATAKKDGFGIKSDGSPIVIPSLWRTELKIPLATIQVRCGAAITLTTNTQKITLVELANGDTDDVLSISNGGVKCSKAGCIRVSVGGFFSSVPAGKYGQIHVYKNSSTVSGRNINGFNAGASATYANYGATEIVNVAANDVIYFYGRVNSGTATLGNSMHSLLGVIEYISYS